MQPHHRACQSPAIVVSEIVTAEPTCIVDHTDAPAAGPAYSKALVLLLYAHCPARVRLRRPSRDGPAYTCRASLLFRFHTRKCSLRQSKAEGSPRLPRFSKTGAWILALRTNRAIQLASGYGRVDVVDLLLKDERVNPNAGENFSIIEASANGHVDVVRLLLNHEDINPRGEAIQRLGKWT